MKIYSRLLTSSAAILLGGFINAVSAGTGPGGVGNADGSSGLVLWLDANEVKLADGVKTSWLDSSGHNHHFTQGNGATFEGDSQSNGFSAFNFDGSSQYFEKPYSATLSNLSAFSLFTTNKLVGKNTHNAIYSDRSGSGQALVLYALPNNDACVNCWDFWTADGSWRTLPGSSTQGNWSTQVSDYQSNSKNMYINGGTPYQASEGFVANSSKPTRVGAGANETGPQFYFNGRIGEVILFNSKLNSANRIIVQNYLAAKYKHATGDDHYSHDGSGYRYDVAGIGQMSDGGHSSSKGRGIILINNPSALTNNQFLFWGHDNQSKTFANTDVPAGVGPRMSRVWAFDNGGVGTVDITIDSVDVSNPSNLVLLVDSDTTFGSGAAVVNGTYNTVTRTMTFAGVTPSASGYFTLARISDAETNAGPGGVGSTDGADDLSLWLDAANYSGATWSDKSGYGHDFTAQNNPGTTATTNGRPAIDFNGANQYFAKPYSASLSNMSTYSLFAVNDNDSASNYGNVYSDRKDSTGAFLLRVDVGDWLFYNGGPSSYQAVVSGVNTMDWATQSIAYGGSGANQKRIYISGDSTVATGQGQFAPNTSVETRVGAGADAAVNEYFDGKISEIILFKKDINEAQRTIVNNYIAAKYNVSIGGYARYALGVTYGFDVAGIGQASDGSSHSSARGTGRVAMSSPAGMGNNEFLMWGNNNADVSSTTSNKPAIATSRLNRIWAFNNGGISTVTMTFDVSGIANADQMQLFYDTNTDFTAGGSLISGSYDATAKTLTFTSVALPSGAGYFTLMVNSDSDGDGVNNDLDNCPNHSNLNQLNTDVLLNNNPDDLGDACDDDDDGDGISDVMENLLDPTGTNSLIPIGGYTDTDGDGAPDNAEGGMIADTDDDNDSVADSFPDNCPLVANPLQTNTDVELNNNPDALGDACDTDIDGDGDLNTPDQDNCPFTINPNQDDLDLDGLGDVCDDDVDGDGRVDNLDNCPLVKNSTQADADGNGYGDVCGKVFVSTSGVTKTGDCSSWALACDDISYAISQAQIDDVAREVFIEAGVYHPAATLSIPAGFSLVGGFNGSEQLATQANSAVNITIISGDVANSLIADVTAKTSASLTTRLIDVFNHGVQAVNEVKLSGLIINAASPSSAIDGGGLRVYSSRVKLSNMQFIANEAANGAALLVDAGSIVKLDHSVFKNNSSANQAGAILLKGNASQLIVTHSLLKANVAVVGGAIYSADSSMLDISDTEFEANDASTSAGAIMLSSTSGQISIKRSSFISNHSDGVAGAISSAGAAGLDITNASFHKNSAEGDGGAIYVNSASGAVSLEYVTLVGNSSATDGGAIYQASASELNIARSLIVGNTAGSEASGHNLYLWDSLKDGGFNLLGFDSKSGVKPEGQFMPEADPNVSSYTGSFTTDVATLDSIVVGVSSYDAGDDVSSVAATRILALTETSVARDVMNLVECGAVIEDQRGQNRQDDSTGMCDIGAHEYTDYTCAEQSQAIRDGGNYYLANCNPANQFVFDFGQLKGLGAMHWYYLCVLSLLLFRPKRLNASQV